VEVKRYHSLLDGGEWSTHVQVALLRRKSRMELRPSRPQTVNKNEGKYLVDEAIKFRATDANKSVPLSKKRFCEDNWSIATKVQKEVSKIEIS
jgi:hypothetical protein